MGQSSTRRATLPTGRMAHAQINVL